MKLPVVPDLSERCTAVMARSGKVAPGLSAAIAGSFQFAMSPWKILARTSGVRLSSVTPSRLKMTAMGET